MKSISDYLHQSKTLLPHSETPRLDVEILLSHVLNKSIAYLMAYPEQVLDDYQAQLFLNLLQQRQACRPIAYIIGKKDFWDLSLTVNEAVLIPRPETELLVELTLEKIKNIPQPKILDLGTGSGAIACALAQERPDAKIVAVDQSPGAIEIALENAQHYQLKNIHYIVTHWCDGLQDQFNVIVSNPPYIDAQDIHLQQGDVQCEPKTALIAADQGLADLKKIIVQAKQRLCIGGVLLLEHGYQQGEAVRDFFQQQTYQAIETHLDLAGLERVSTGIFYE